MSLSGDYPFSRKLDDHLLGREYELSINIITPINDASANPDAVRMQNMGREELAIVLQPDVRFVRDLTLFKQTDKFVRQARTGAPQPGRDRIVLEKGEQNARREKDLQLRLRSLIAASRLFVRGDELDLGGEDPQERIVKAFQTLVDKVYVNLPMLRGVGYVEADTTYGRCSIRRRKTQLPLLTLRSGLVTVLCRSPISLCYLGLECERADAAQI